MAMVLLGSLFSWGTVCARGSLGNSIGQVTADNYYWGVDSTSTLWGGKQTNRATSPTWRRAMMIDGSQDTVTLWSGNLSSGSVTITNGYKYAALILAGLPGQGEEDLQFACIPSGSASPCQFASNMYWIGYRTTLSGNNIILTILENPDSGSFRYVWGLLRHSE